MPTLLKFVTKFLSEVGYGWSEVHYKQSSSDNPNMQTQLDNFWDNVCPARAQLLGKDCNIVGARVSYPRSGAIASYGIRRQINGDQDHGSAAAFLSLAVVFKDVTFTKSKVVHLRGFWDAVETDQSYHPEDPAAAGWDARFIAWKDSLIQGGYGWPSKNPTNSRSGAGVTYAREVDDTIKFTLPAPGMNSVPVNSIQQVRFSRFNRSNSILNRALLVQVVSATELRTIAQIAAGDMTAKGRFNYRAPDFLAYHSTASISVGERRMGRPLDRYPGRSKARPLI